MPTIGILLRKTYSLYRLITSSYIESIINKRNYRNGPTRQPDQRTSNGTVADLPGLLEGVRSQVPKQARDLQFPRHRRWNIPTTLR